MQRWLLLALLAALLAGCATPPQQDALLRGWPATLPARVSLDRTPFVPQDDYECGPAVLAMLAQAAGQRVELASLKPQVYLPGRQGSLQVELLAGARRQGLAAYRLAPQLDSVLSELAAGHPVGVFQNLSLPIYPVWHYAVAIGYDREQQTITLRSGREANQVLPLSVFERTWARADHWAFLALAPENLPATLADDPVARALIALERVDAAAARRGYEAALLRWPEQPLLLIGAGNAAYAQGDRASALAAYRRMAERQPQLPEGWNNLAQVLMESGDRPGALAAVARAIALGGPRLAQYQALEQKLHEPR
jgi:tetratricopeptide (TPR) repeat protein